MSTEFYTKEEVEEVLKRLARAMHGRLPVHFHPLLKDMNKQGFTFTSVTWNKMQGTYYGVPFMFYAREDIVNAEYEYKINW